MHTVAFIVIEDYIIITSKCLLTVLPAHFSFLLLLLAILSFNQLVLCKKVCQNLKITESLILILKIRALREKTSLKMFTSLFQRCMLKGKKILLESIYDNKFPS